MTLSDDQLRQFVEHLNTIDSNGIECPVCHQRHWGISREIYETREFQNGVLLGRTPISITPYVTMTCNNCGNTLFFNAIFLGLVNQNHEAVQPDNNNSGSDNNQ